jgi:hypothetical protein
MRVWQQICLTFLTTQTCHIITRKSVRVRVSINYEGVTYSSCTVLRPLSPT